jgi:hypothetical protein
LLVVLYGCKTWSLILREDENRVLRRIYGANRKEVTGEWNKLNKKELNDLYVCRLRVLENRVFRRIFGPKGDAVTGEWRKLHNEELNILHTSPNNVRVTKSRRMKWAGHVASMGERRGVYRVLVGKPGGKRPLGRPRLRWADNNNKINF